MTNGSYNGCKLHFICGYNVECRIVHFTQINVSHQKSWRIDVGSKFTDRHKKIKSRMYCKKISSWTKLKFALFTQVTPFTFKVWQGVHVKLCSHSNISFWKKRRKKNPFDDQTRQELYDKYYICTYKVHIYTGTSLLSFEASNRELRV